MKKLLSLLLILTLTLSLAACSGNGNAPAAGAGENGPEAEGTGASQEDPAGAGAESVVLGSLGYFPNSGWDAGSGYEGWYIASYGVAETLYRIDENFEAYPWLAQSAEQLDSLKMCIRDRPAPVTSIFKSYHIWAESQRAPGYVYRRGSEAGGGAAPIRGLAGAAVPKF